MFNPALQGPLNDSNAKKRLVPRLLLREGFYCVSTVPLRKGETAGRRMAGIQCLVWVGRSEVKIEGMRGGSHFCDTREPFL